MQRRQKAAYARRRRANVEKVGLRKGIKIKAFGLANFLPHTLIRPTPKNGFDFSTRRHYDKVHLLCTRNPEPSALHSFPTSCLNCPATICLATRRKSSMPWFCAVPAFPAKIVGQTNTTEFISTIPSMRVTTLLHCGRQKRWIPCGNSNTPGCWRSASRDVESPIGFTQNGMKQFQMPTSRNPAMVRRRAENHTREVRKSPLRSTETGQ